MQFWISVTSKDHVLEGLGDGFIQAQGNKADTLHQLAKGDVVFFYSPGTLFRAGEILQAFTGVARVTDAAAASVTTGRAVPAWRRRIEPLPSHEAPAEPIVSELAFIADKEHWATAIGRGMFVISKADAQRIAAAMKATL